MIPHSNASANLLTTSEDTDWLHGDPWRVLRIQSEFVDGFNALAKLGPAVSIYGSARTRQDDPLFWLARRTASLIAEKGAAIITGGGPGIMEAANQGASEVSRHGTRTS